MRGFITEFHFPETPDEACQKAAMAAKAEQLAEAKQRVRDLFVAFEHKEGSKLVDSKDIPTIVRCLGVNPTTAQVQQLQERLAAAAPGAGDGSSSAAAAANSSLLAVEHCETIIASWLLESTAATLVRDDFHMLLRAFKALDPDTKGYLDAQQLRTLLTSCADGLSSDEANAMISVAADDQGRVMCQEYAMLLATDGRPV